MENNNFDLDLEGVHAIVKAAINNPEKNRTVGFYYGAQYVVNRCQHETDNRVVRALIFWQYLRKAAPLYDWRTRRGVLTEYASHNNEFIAAVAMIESLPTSVWRRLLWRHNIFFGSFRGFLEELRPQDMAAIRNNFLDMTGGRTPRVISWFERVFKKMTLKNLLEEDYDADARRKSKGAWSFNLAGLDFGFNCFAKEKGKKIRFEARTWAEYLRQIPRFFSLKDHEEDFVVNTEFGKYWWLYRTARSSYGWRPGHEVCFKKKICPGFWWTLIVQSLFWIFSPLALIIYLPYFTGGDGGLSILTRCLLLPPAIIMPAWVLSALIRSFLRLALPEKTREKAGDAISRTGDRLDGWIGRNKASIGKTLKVLDKVIVILLGAIFFLGVFLPLRYVFGDLGAGLLLASLYGIIVQKKLRGNDFGDFPEWNQWLHVGAIAVAVICLIVKQFAYIKIFLSGLWMILSALGLISLFFAVLFGAAIVLAVLLWKVPENEYLKKCQDHAIGIFFLVGFLGLFGGLGLSAYSIYEGTFRGLAFISLLIYTGMAFGFYYLLIKNDEDTCRLGRVVNFELNEGFSLAFIRRMLKKNAYCAGLSREERVDFMDQVTNLIRRIVRRRDHDEAIKLIFPHINPPLLAELKAKEEILLTFRTKGYILVFLEYYFQVKDLEMARDMTEKKIEADEKRAAVMKKIGFYLLVPIRPLRKILQGLNWVLDLFGELFWIAKTFYRERCPYMAESRVLDENDL